MYGVVDEFIFANGYSVFSNFIEEFSFTPRMLILVLVQLSSEILMVRII